MAICRNCGSIIDDGLKFCPNCGTSLAAQTAGSADPVFAAAGITVGGAQQFAPPEYNTQRRHDQQPNSGNPQGGIEQQRYAQTDTSVYECETKGTGCYSVYPTIKYIGLILLQAIPLAGFIAIIIFSFNSSNLNRRNFCRAILLLRVIAASLAVVAAIVFGASIAELFSASGNSSLLELYGLTSIYNAV